MGWTRFPALQAGLSHHGLAALNVLAGRVAPAQALPIFFFPADWNFGARAGRFAGVSRRAGRGREPGEAAGKV
jgi:hypothetical protein